MKSTLRILFQLAVLTIIVRAIAWFFLPAPETKWAVVNLDQVKSGSIVALGDSLTEGVAVGEKENYPWLLSQAFGEPVINAGVAGDTTEGGLRRLEADVLAYKPRLVFIELGGNDLKQGVPAQQAFGNLRAIIAQLQANGIVVVLLGIDGKHVYGPEYDLAYKALAKETGCILVSDILGDLIGKPSLLLDQVHPNGKGYVVLTEKVLVELRYYKVALALSDF